MQKVTKSVEKKSSQKLPSKFGFLIDGWSDMETSTHYLADFAVYENHENSQRKRRFCYFRHYWMELTISTVPG